jgi:hypothetical protein
VVEA